MGDYCLEQNEQSLAISCREQVAFQRDDDDVCFVPGICIRLPMYWLIVIWNWAVFQLYVYS